MRRKFRKIEVSVFSSDRLKTMKRILLIPSLLLALGLFVTGCSSTGLLNSGHLTNVELGKKNYKVVATGVSGHSRVGNVFGMSLGLGIASTSQGIIPVGDPRLKAEFKLLRKKPGISAEETNRLAKVKRARFNPYEAALDDLWKNFEAQHGAAAGRALALTNVRFDNRDLNLFYYSHTNLTVTADVIEFVD